MRREETDWEEVYGEWKKSGQAQQEYCKTKGIGVSAFKNGVVRQRKKGQAKLANEGRPFVAVKIKPETDAEPKRLESQAYCEIRFGTGGRVVIEDKEALEGLRQLVGALSR